MPSFSAVLNYSNCANREKDKSNYHFPSTVKNNGKKGLKHSKVRRENWLGQTFRRDLTERMLERTIIKIILSTSPSSAFSHKVHNIRFEKQTCILSQLMIPIELGPPVSKSSTKISKFYDSTDSENKFHKTRIKNWLSIDFEMGSPWLRTYSFNHYTIFNIQYNGDS